MYNERLQELEVITNERDQVRGEYEGLRSRRLDEFMAGFTIISIKLKEMYQVRQEVIYTSSICSSTAGNV